MNAAALMQLLSTPSPPLSQTVVRTEPDTKLIDGQGDELNASEAIYGFAGWLTSRKTSVTWGSDHPAASASLAADEYIAANGLPALRDGYAERLTVPPEPPE